MSEADLANPYVGPTPFTENESDRFFGRTEETRELASLVIARRAVLLYAQSGAGKTSLLQASLIPELKRRKRVETFPIARVMGGGVASRNLYVENALANLFPNAQSKTFLEAFTPALAESAKSRRQPHLVIFDQFEEIFTFHPELTEQRRTFFEQLGDCLERYPQLSLLLSMREDYLADLEMYAALLPDRIRTRMRLERLGAENAVEAIREPASKAGMPFANGAAEELVDNLRRIRTGTANSNGFALGQYVEPVQLQIVCRQLWSRLTEDSSRHKPEIDSEDINTHANVDDALIHFYRDSIGKAQRTGVTERTLRRWFSERLITPAGTRGLVYRGKEETDGLPNLAVDILRDRYIIRADLRAGNVWYELAHDRLVGPVQQDNLAWKASYRNPIAEAMERGSDNYLTHKGLVEGLQFAKENPHELTQNEEVFLKKSVAAARKSRAVQRRLIVGALAVILLLSLATGFSFWEAKRATEARKNTKAALDRTVLAELKAKHEEEEAIYEKEKATAARDRAQGAEEIAKAQTALAQEQTRIAVSRQLAAQAVNQPAGQLDLALLLAVEGYKAADTYEARNSLLTVLQHEPRASLFMHAFSSSVAGMAVSQDGKTLTWCGRDGFVEVWDPSKPRLLHTMSGLPDIAHLAISPDGKALVSVDDNVPITVRSIATGALLNNITSVRGKRITQLLFSPSGDTFASASDDGSAILWRVTDWRQIAPELTSSYGEVYSLAFSPDGNTLAVGHDRGTIELWNVRTHKRFSTALSLGTLAVTGMAFSPDSKTLATVSNDSGLRLWNVLAGSEIGHSVGDQGGTLTSVAFSASGKMLASGSSDGSIALWDWAANQLISQGEHFSYRGDAVWNVAFVHDDRMLAASGTYGVRVWDLANAQPIARVVSGFENSSGFKDTVQSLAFSRDGRMLAAGGISGTLVAWDLLTRKRYPIPGVKSSGTIPLSESNVSTLSFGPDGTRIFSGSGDLVVWDLARPDQIGKLIGSDVTGFALSLDGAALASANCLVRDESPQGRHAGRPCTDGEIRLLDVSSGRPLGQFSTGKHSQTHLTFSPDGKMLASIDGTAVLVWDVAARKPAGSPLSFWQGYATALSFTPDSRAVAALRNGSIVLWNLTDHQLADSIRSSGKSGRHPASGTYDRSFSLWDILYRKSVFNSNSPSREANISASAFSPSLKTVASTANTNLLLQDVATRQPLGPPLDGHAGEMGSVAFSPDGKTVASGGMGQIVLWDVSPESWRSRACRVANRNLSWQEWRDYFGGQPYKKTCPDLAVNPSVIKGVIDIEEAAVAAGDSQAASLAGQQVVEWAAELTDAQMLNTICWNEALAGLGRIVLPICERAVLLAPENADLRDSRGVARAVTGDYRGAADDFRHYLRYAKDEAIQKQRKGWIVELQNGRNPFNEPGLRALRETELRRHGASLDPN